MTVINTNVAALQARTYALQATDKMQTAMERLSSGLRINSAADDAAGLAVANKMESQLRGMDAAIRNSQDGISLVQTAESGMSEVSNMIIRMRELAVQMNNGVYSDSDRKNAQLEVTALLAEVDKIADNTAFNNVKVLDGTYATDIRAGNTNVEIINVTIDSTKTKDLGSVAEETVAASSVATGTRTDNGDNTQTSTLNVEASSKLTVNLSTEAAAFVSGAAGTITYEALGGASAAAFQVDASTGAITSQAAVAFDATTAANNVKALELTITDREAATTAAVATSTLATGTTNVTSSFNIEESDAFTVGLSTETATLAGAAVATGETRVYELTDTAGAANAAYFTIDSTTGVLTRAAGDNFDATTAANNQKAVSINVVDRIDAITVAADGTGTGAASYTQNDAVAAALVSTVSLEEAGSWSVAASTKLAAFTGTGGATHEMHYRIDSASADAADFKIGATTGTLQEADSFANGVEFDHVTAGNNIRVVKVEAVDLQKSNDLGNLVATVATKDGYTAAPTKGVVGGAVGAVGYTFDEAIQVVGQIDTNAVRAAFFDVTAGFTASDGSGMTLSLREGSGTDVADGKITWDGTNEEWKLVDGTFAAGASYTFTIRATDDTDTTKFADTLITLTNTKVAATATEQLTITATESTVIATDTVTVNITASDTYKDTITLNVTKAEDHLENVDVSTKAGAARAVTILDKALDEISSSQAKLGAIQNRLQHNIDNLSNGAMLTETARGRITDADFARETSELSKQQILGQAATSMLAQANQSKQSILALLQ